MDSGALYDLLYSNAPEIFFQIQVLEGSLYFGSCAAARGDVFRHGSTPFISLNYYFNRKFYIMADFVH